MSDGKGSKKRENRIRAPYVVRVHEGEKGGKKRAPQQVRRKGGKNVLLANLFFRAEEGRDINTQKKIGGEKKKNEKDKYSGYWNNSCVCVLALLAFMHAGFSEQ